MGCAKACSPGLVSCGGECLTDVFGGACCIGPQGRGIICGKHDECCHGVCALAGTGCSQTCAEGLVHCGGECLAAQGASSCCVGPSGKGIICKERALCSNGVCLMHTT